MKNDSGQTVPHCPICETHVLLVEIQENEFDFQCPRCHTKFEVKMKIRHDKHGNVKRDYILRYILRSEWRIITEKEP